MSTGISGGLDFQALFDASPNPYLVLDRRLHIVGANRAYLASVKRDLSDIVGRWAWDAFPADADTLKQAVASFEQVIHTGEPDTMAPLRFDVPSPENQGGGMMERYWSITHIPVLDASGAVSLVLQHPIDVTELQQLRGFIQPDDESRTSDPVPSHSGIFDRARSVYEANLKLRAERQRLETFFQQMPGFVAVLRDPAHVFEYVNDAYIAIAGQRDFIGRSVREVFPELAGQGFYELLDQVYRSGTLFEARTLPITLSDGDRFIDLLYQPIRDAEGVVTGIFVGGYDVTEQVKSRAALVESEVRYRTLFETIDVGFCIVEMKFDDAGDAVDYRIAEANPAFERQTGAKVAGLWVSEFAPNLERHWFDTYGHVALTGEPAHFENKADVFGRWFDVRALRLGEPAAHRVAIFFSDITARKTMEEELRQLNALLENRVEERTTERDRLWSMPNLLLSIVGFDTTIVAVNPGWAALLGWAEAELVGRSYAALIHPEDAQRSLDWAARLAAGQQVEDLVNLYRCKDGSYRAIAWTITRGEGVFHCVGRDVTAEREQTAALARAEEQLRQSQKMEAVGQLTGGLAHDFNNLLAGISGSLELMQTRLQQGRLNDVERYMTAAQGAAKRAAALTHRLLAFSRRQTLDPKPTDVNRLIVGMHEMVQRTVGPAIAIEVVGAAGLWPALVDPSQLENALLNLCINARDAMPNGGRITVETANKWLDERAAHQHDMPEGQYLSLSVTDTGTGMRPEVIARVFEPFFTTKPIGEGTGLGLSMIYGFARQSGGQVRIYSELGEGTTVCIYLPRHHGEVDSEDEASRHDMLARSEQGATVLIVDDEPTVRLLLTDILEDLGYTALEAGDSAKGLKILQSDIRIDLLVTDVGLPGDMNGRQMADAARVFRPDLRVLFITGYAENAVLGHGHLAPGMAVLTKPFAMDTMAARIRSLIEAGRDAEWRSGPDKA